MKRKLDTTYEPPSLRAKKECQKEDTNTPIISTLNAPISPPRRRSRPNKKPQLTPSSTPYGDTTTTQTQEPPSLAAIEAGQVQVTDHLGIFSSRLSQCIHPPLSSSETPPPRLPIAEWKNLYQRNERPDGHHFVIHQHDHPIAGPHYDLRLQFSETSSVSWSIMYGLPGDPNSRRLNRNATETRVHSCWNHLIETASPNTGSMIIWDTGEYEILPYQMESAMPETETDDSRSVSSESSYPTQEQRNESEKLKEAFRNVLMGNMQRKIRLRLHGTRLPKDYTIALRMDKTSQPTGPPRIPRKRRRRTKPSLGRGQSQPSTTQSTSSDSSLASQSPSDQNSRENEQTDTKTDSDADKIDYQIRLNNAYPGSTNSIGSIHQRRWFITLDRLNSGFINEPGSGPGKKRWVRKRDPDPGSSGELLGFEPFYVRGPDVERSVVTGRLGGDVLDDEEVEGFVPRRGWRGILE